jgi:copper(I)-binding protein
MCSLILLSRTLFLLLSTTHGADAQGLRISHAWIREAPPNAMASAGYLTIANPGPTDRRLVGVASPNLEWLEPHRTVQEGGVANMQPQDSMPVPAGGRLELKPADYQLMMMKSAKRLQAGDEVAATLEFANGEQTRVTLVVRKASGGGHEHPNDSRCCRCAGR